MLKCSSVTNIILCNFCYKIFSVLRILAHFFTYASYSHCVYSHQAQTRSVLTCRSIGRLQVAIGVLTAPFTAALTATTRITWANSTCRSTIRNRSPNHRDPTRTTISTANFTIMAAPSDTAIVIYRRIRIRSTAAPERPTNAPSEPARDSSSTEASFGKRI